MFYVDTSVLVAALVKEAHSDRVLDWLGEQAPRTLCASDWSITEFSSALSVKMRTGQIGAEQRAFALSAFAELIEESFNVLAISGNHFHLAARFSDRHELSIKAGDALHVAVASDNRVSLCTLDRKLAKAGRALGAMTHLL
jgi:predicted nucleic acid-binding protein